MAAEQVADPVALAQPGDHAVEAGLQQADLAAVVDGHVDIGVAGLDARHRVAHRPHRLDHRRRATNSVIAPDGEREHAQEDHRRGQRWADICAPAR